MLREVRDWVEELACRSGLDTWSPTARKVAFAVAIAVVVLAVWKWGSGGTGEALTPRAPSAPPAAAAAEASAAEPASPASVTVQVVGAVRRPGVYAVPGGSRVIDAVNAAGGLLGNADQAAVNLARAVNDGEQIPVPVQGAAASPAGGAGAAGGGAAGAAPAPGAKVDLNSATAEQLDALPGVGPATAKKIVDDRTENGPFRKVEDLMRVPGIGAKKLDALKDLVTAG